MREINKQKGMKMGICELNELEPVEVKKELKSYTSRVLFKMLLDISYSEKYSMAGKLVTNEMNIKSGMR